MDELFDIDSEDKDVYNDNAVGMTDAGCSNISIQDKDDMQT